MKQCTKIILHKMQKYSNVFAYFCTEYYCIFSAFFCTFLYFSLFSLSTNCAFWDFYVIWTSLMFSFILVTWFSNLCNNIFINIILGWCKSSCSSIMHLIRPKIWYWCLEYFQGFTVKKNNFYVFTKMMVLPWVTNLHKLTAKRRPQ
jgi:hypothetical protein